MVLPPAESIALVDRLDGVAARISEADGEVHQSRLWPTLQLVSVASDPTTQSRVAPSTIGSTQASPSVGNSAEGNKPPPPPSELRWPADWELGVTYTAPATPEDVADYRDPYIAVWISDDQNKPLATLFLLGQDPKYARNNFIWWDSYNDQRATHEVEMKSRATLLSGQYTMYWLGGGRQLESVADWEVSAAFRDKPRAQ